MTPHAARIARLRTQIKLAGLDGLLVNHLPNVRYLCGYTGSAGLLLVTRTQASFLTDFRYQEQARHEVRGARRIIIKRDLYSDLLERTDIARLRRVGFESQHLFFSQYEFLRKGVKRVVPTAAMVEQLRQVKDGGELKAIAHAAAIADRAFARIVREIRPGMTELAIAARLEGLMKSFGAQRPSFETIVGSGPNGALPHAKPGPRKVRRGDLIVLDFGAYYQGYCSDMTRTVALGEPSDKQKLIYSIVQRAQLAGLDAVQAGVSGKVADSIARAIIVDAGYGKGYGHGLGHGVGMEVHELPRLSKLSDNILPANSVVTVEPGIYLPGWGGVRIEDLVVVTKHGNKILSRSPKELVIIK
jgi:Xaa-Pro aminopeptidase